jgi:hypothetical protein
MSVATMIARIGITCVVTRYAAGAYVGHTNVPGATTTFSVLMSVQPLNGRELLNIPEAQRTRQWIKAYCATELRTANQALGIRADRVLANGVLYEVQRVEFWTNPASTLAPHWRLQLAEVNTEVTGL